MVEGSGGAVVEGSGGAVVEGSGGAVVEGSGGAVVEGSGGAVGTGPVDTGNGAVGTSVGTAGAVGIAVEDTVDTAVGLSIGVSCGCDLGGSGLPEPGRSSLLIGEQPGKNAPEAIFTVCPLVTPLSGLKYGRLFGGTHGSSGTCPQGYPDTMPAAASEFT